MVDFSSLSAENIIATAVTGVILGVIGVKKYLKEYKAPTTQTGDRLIPGLSIADMSPLREIATAQSETQPRIAAALESIAVSQAGLLRLLTEKAQEEEFDEEVERRLKDRLAEELEKREVARRRPPR